MNKENQLQNFPNLNQYYAMYCTVLFVIFLSIPDVIYSKRICPIIKNSCSRMEKALTVHPSGE
jgi:hypothetical protein